MNRQARDRSPPPSSLRELQLIRVASSSALAPARCFSTTAAAAASANASSPDTFRSSFEICPSPRGRRSEQFPLGYYKSSLYERLMQRLSCHIQIKAVETDVLQIAGDTAGLVGYLNSVFDQQ